MSVYDTKFWKKHWDEGVDDLPPAAWETTFTSAIRRTFEQHPRMLALEFSGFEMDYGELEDASNRFANGLISRGFVKGDIVAINLPNVPQFVVTYVGTLKAGCTVSGLSPLLTEEQMRFQLADLGAGGKKVCLVTLDIIVEKRFSKIASGLPHVQLVVASNIAAYLSKMKQVLGKALKKIPSGKVSFSEAIVDYQRFLAGASAHLPEVAITPDDIMLIMYTGGTTGPSKGAVITHRNLVADLLITDHWLKWEPAAGVAVCGLPFFHLGGLCFLNVALYLGWTLPLLPNPRDTGHFVQLIKKYKPRALLNVPALFQMLLNDPRFLALDLSCIENCFSGAAPFPKESQELLERVVGPDKLIELYGMTELSPVITMTPLRGKKKLGTVGLPFPNTDIKLVDTQSGKDVPLGEPGEICARGPMVMAGYYHNPSETAHVIDADGYMHTGDVGIMDEDGYVSIVDRTKDMISVGGYKVFSAKVENVLAKHPAVDLIALIGVPNPERPGSEFVNAYVQIRPDSEKGSDHDAIAKELIAYAKEHCAPYEVPRTVEFVNPMPLTAVGKVDKKVLRASARQGSPQH